MKCKDCDYKMKGFFACKPDKYVCIGVKEPFVIEDINVECTEYPEKQETIGHIFATGGYVTEPILAEAYVGDDGIYVPYDHNPIYHQLLMSKELFVEAYNKWIKQENKYEKYHSCSDNDDVDCWSDD